MQLLDQFVSFLKRPRQIVFNGCNGFKGVNSLLHFQVLLGHGINDLLFLGYDFVFGNVLIFHPLLCIHQLLEVSLVLFPQFFRLSHQVFNVLGQLLAGVLVLFQLLQKVVSLQF
jgi:hypothetical protein